MVSILSYKVIDIVLVVWLRRLRWHDLLELLTLICTKRIEKENETKGGVRMLWVMCHLHCLSVDAIFLNNR